MNLNEKCLLKFLTNPIGIFNTEKETTNINRYNELYFANLNISNISVSKKLISK